MVRSFIFNILFYTTSIVGLIFLCPLLLIGNYFSHRIPRWWSLWVSWLLKMVSRTHYKVQGTIPSSTVIYAIKHQSAWETIALNHILERPVFVLKKELLWIPFFGLYLQKAGMIALDRGGGLNTLKNLIKQTKDRVARHRSVIIFPEGTRSAPGTHNPYKKGIYVLYKNLNVPVVPVALNSGVYWPRRTFMKYPGTIHVKFLPSIPPGLAEDVFMGQLEHTIETESLKLFKKS
ncbi:MAG: lysophospholipid acyltransferase family protein [Alphaproteobacteria bacterium]